MTNFRYEYPNPHLPRVKQPATGDLASAIKEKTDEYDRLGMCQWQYRTYPPPADYVREPHPASTPEYDPHRTVYVGANEYDDGDDMGYLIGLGLAAISGCVVGLAIGWGIWG